MKHNEYVTRKEQIEDFLMTIILILACFLGGLICFYCGMQFEKTQRFEQLRTELKIEELK